MGNILLVLMLGTTLLVRAEDTTYTTKYDNIDIEAILQNDRLLNNYVGCLLDQNPCTPDGAELRSMSQYLFSKEGFYLVEELLVCS